MSERDELAKAMRGAKTLGEIIEKQCRDVLDVTGLHHLIIEDGDGHWDVVWMRLFEMRDELASLKEATIGRERLRGDSWRDRAQGMEVSRDAAIERAEAAEEALEASKPRTITTAEELDAVRPGTTILTANGFPYIACAMPPESGYKILWSGETPEAFSNLWMTRSGSLPATVLHEGEASK
jgi:hypothetical protein